MSPFVPVPAQVRTAPGVPVPEVIEKVTEKVLDSSATLTSGGLYWRRHFVTMDC